VDLLAVACSPSRLEKGVDPSKEKEKEKKMFRHSLRIGLSTVYLLLPLYAGSIQASALQDPWNAEEYAHHSTSQKEAAADLLAWISLRGDEHLLDVGCGDGKISEKLAYAVPQGHVEGIDVSPSMISFAQAHHQAPNLTFSVRNAVDCHGTKIYDVIVSFTALQWAPDHKKFLESAHQSLKQGGHLAFTLPLGLPVAMQRAVEEVCQKIEWRSYFERFSTGWNFGSPRQWHQLAETLGFVEERAAVVSQKDRFPSREAFEAFVRQWFPYLRPLPHDQQERFLKEVVDRFLSYDTAQPSGAVEWKIRRFEWVGKKS
jgi:trans-aconitate 2-methyltransferase